LIEHFIKKYSEIFKLEHKELSDEVAQKFIEYPWPGNVRELENTIKRILLLIPDNVINLEHINDEIKYIISKRKEADEAMNEAINEALNLFVSEHDNSLNNVYQEVINRTENELFKIILEKTKGNKKKAAGMLGINRNTLSKKLSESDLDY